MTETGTVIKITKDGATVSIKKKDECSKCGMCLFGKGAESIEFSCNNTINAKEGDTVIIERSEKGKLLGVFMVFLVPLLLIGVSLLIGYFIINNELWALFISVISIAVWYIILSFADKKLRTVKKFKNEITAVLEKETENE